MSDRVADLKLRILHVASSFPLTANDSTAPFMGEMLEALAKRGHDVTALVPRVGGLAEGDRGGVSVVGVPYAPRPLQVWGYGRSLDEANKLRGVAAVVTPAAIAAMAMATRRVVRRSQPDVAHLHWVLPLGLLATVVPQGTPVVVSAHGADAAFSTGRLRPVAKLVLRRADAVVAASTQILDVLASVEPSIGDKAHVIPHGANAALFRPRPRDESRARLGITSSSPIILGVGRLVAKKGFDSLVAAISHVETAEAQLYIVGDGPEALRLEALVPRDRADRVHFVGACDREQVADWYAAADVVVVPGRPTAGDVDSGPVVLVEALAAGRPVVATRIGMAPDAIRTGENGVLLDSDDPSAIADSIDTAVEHAGPWGLEARKTFERIGDWGRVARDLEEVYQAVREHRSG